MSKLEYLKRRCDDLSELIQCDLQCVLDGYDDELITMVCQVVVDRINNFKKVIESMDELQ